MDARRVCVFSLARRADGLLGALYGLGSPVGGSMRCLAAWHCFFGLAAASMFVLGSVGRKRFGRRRACDLFCFMPIGRGVGSDSEPRMHGVCAVVPAVFSVCSQLATYACTTWQRD